MFEYLRNKYESVCLKAKYERIVQTQLLELAEKQTFSTRQENGNEWQLLGESGYEVGGQQRVDARNESRRLAIENPYARNILRLLEIYVVGPGLKLSHVSRDGQEETVRIARAADRLWEEFLDHNQQHYSFREHARRSWRDGESFLRLYPQTEWPPTVRFIDPERIDTPANQDETQGILTASDDVESPRVYQVVDFYSRELQEEVLVDEMLHTRVGVDSNEKRGLPILMSILGPLKRFDQWIDIELQARRLQASIVLWRRVQGSGSQVSQLADQASGGRSENGARNERFRPGTIVTTSQGTDLQFLQPNTNFSDAIPLGRMLLLNVAAGQGIPEFMLTSDASNGSYASTMVSEGPAVKMFQSEQQFFTGEFNRLWRWVINEAIRIGELPSDFRDLVTGHWSLPQLVNRDRAKERMADTRLVEQGVLSRAEVARRDGVDPEVMRSEVSKEQDPGRGSGVA